MTTQGVCLLALGEIETGTPHSKAIFEKPRGTWSGAIGEVGR